MSASESDLGEKLKEAQLSDVPQVIFKCSVKDSKTTPRALVLSAEFAVMQV